MIEDETINHDPLVAGNSHYNPVHVEVKEATGAAFLGILAIILLFALLLLQRQNRALLRQLGQPGERPSP